MNSKPESPRFILILSSLFLLAYAAYNLGVAWMDSVPENTAALRFVAQSSASTITATPSITPTNLPLFWITPTTTPAEAAPTFDVTVTPEALLPDITITPTPPPAILTPTLVSTPTPTTANANPPPEKTPTPTVVLPTATSPGEAYPGPGTPLASPPATGDPYPGITSEPTSGPGETEDPYPGPEITPTPFPTATVTPAESQPDPTEMPAPTEPIAPPPQISPTLTAVPSIFTTLAYSETRVISNGAVQQAVWSQDGSSLALATAKGLFLYDVELLKKQSVIDAGAILLSARFAFNDDLLVTGGSDAEIRWWDLETKGYLGAFSEHILGVVHLDLPDFGNFLASGSDDATVRVWDVSNFYNQGVDSAYLLHTFRDPVTRVTDMDVSPNGEMVTAASQRHVHIWNPQSGVVLRTISQPEGWYTALAFSPDSQVLTTAYDGRRLEFWNTSTWARVKFIRLFAPVHALAYAPDGSLLAVGFEDGRIQIWDVRSKLLRADLAGHAGLTSLAFDPIGNHFVTSSSNGTLRVWDLAPLRTPE